jgi:hypothetical protein
VVWRRMLMFEDSLIESGGRLKTNRGLTSSIAFLLEAALVGFMVLLPLLFTDALPKAQLMTFLAAPPPPPPPPPPPAAVAVPVVAEAAPVEIKVKVRKPKQRSCDEKDAKGKLCAGHLKRWYKFGEDIKAQAGANAEVYRCEHCHTIYLSAPGYEDRSGTLKF